MKHIQLNYHSTSVALLRMVLASGLPFLVSAQTNQSTSFELPQSQPGACAYWWASFSLTAGEKVNVEWSTRSQVPVAVDLYIATSSGAGAVWYCDVGPESLFSNLGAFGSMHWVAPSAGMYTLLVVNDGLFAVSDAVTSTTSNVTILHSSTGYGAARQPPFCPINPIRFPEC